MTIKDTETLREKLQNSCDLLIRRIGQIQIGSTDLFPYGWRKAAKGRTVWRIVEEVITQNLEKYHNDFNLDSIHPSDSEVTVYDMKCVYGNLDAYINIKSAVVGGKLQKEYDQVLLQRSGRPALPGGVCGRDGISGHRRRPEP